MRLFFCIFLLFLCSKPWAAVPQDDELAGLSFAELGDIRVSVASNADERLLTSPSSVTVFSAEDIRRLGISTLDDLLRFIPGFYVARDSFQGQSSSIAVRGRRTVSDSPDVLLLYNGMRLNNIMRGGITDGNRRLSLAGVRQVEVIRGPGSALYGGNAFLGVINVISDVQESWIEVSAGDHEKRRAELAGRLGAWQVSGSAFHDRGEQMRGLQPKPDETFRNASEGGDLHLRYQAHDLDFQWMHNERDEGGALLFGTLSDQNDYRSDRDVFRVSYGLLRQENLKLDLSGEWWDAEYRVTRELAPAEQMAALMAGSVAMMNLSRLREQVSAVGFSGEWTHANDSRTQFGVSWKDESLREASQYSNYDRTAYYSTILGAPVPIDYYGSYVRQQDILDIGSRDNAGAYVQHIAALSHEWRYTVGARYDRYSDFGESWNPRMALVWQPTVNRVVKMMVATAFRAPSVSEMSVSNSVLIAPNPALQPEEVRTTEFGWAESLGKVEVVTTAFHNRFNDVVVTGPGLLPGDPRVVSVNAGKGETSGVEVEVHAVLSEELSLKASVTSLLQQLQELSLPRTTASVLAQWTRGDWSAGVTLFHADHVDQWFEGNKKTLGAYQLLGAHVAKAIGRSVTLEWRAENILDQDYKTLSYDVPRADGAPNPGISSMLGVRCVF